jgi:Fic family protein
MAYNWQQPDWPDFHYKLKGLNDVLFAFMEQTGGISGVLHALNEELQWEAIIQLMVAEAIKTSEIEGEYLSRQDVLSSIRNNLGLEQVHHAVKDKKADGVGALMVAVRQSYATPLTQKDLFAWHILLMSGHRHIKAGAWRSHAEPMQVISGALGKETIHFEAPPSSKVNAEMKRFIRWFNASAPNGANELKIAVIRSAIAHLYFESIHPFEDRNGRIGRAIAEKALAQSLGRPVLLSLSRAIETDRAAYYEALKKAQCSNDVTAWISYFANICLLAQQQARSLVDFILVKTKFFDHFKNQLNERQQKAIQRMFQAGPEGFEGGMNTKKYISLTHASKATATRDLQHLAAIGGLVPQGGGRSTHYHLNLEFGQYTALQCSSKPQSFLTPGKQ